MKPDVTWCPRCQMLHPEGQHRATKSNPVADEIVDRPTRNVEGQDEALGEASRGRREPRHNRKLNDPATVKADAPPGAKFDRTAYQREYMKDKRAAKKVGLTVAEYRARRLCSHQPL